MIEIIFQQLSKLLSATRSLGRLFCQMFCFVRFKGGHYLSCKSTEFQCSPEVSYALHHKILATNSHTPQYNVVIKIHRLWPFLSPVLLMIYSVLLWIVAIKNPYRKWEKYTIPLAYRGVSDECLCKIYSWRPWLDRPTTIYLGNVTHVTSARGLGESIPICVHHQIVWYTMWFRALMQGILYHSHCRLCNFVANCADKNVAIQTPWTLIPY